MKLDAIMKRFPQTIESTDTLMHARDFIVWGGFEHLPVLDRMTKGLVGILTAGDISRHQEQRDQSPWNHLDDSVEMAMTREVHSASPEDSLHEACARMASVHIGCLPVMRQSKLVGLVTSRDLQGASIGAHPKSAKRTHPLVAQVMALNPKTVHPHDSLLDAAARMHQYRLRHLPVIDGERRILGMLSDRDVQACIGDPSQVFAGGCDRYDSSLEVRHAMKRPVAVATPEQRCTSAARTLADSYASVVPVVDDAQVLVGIVTYVDLLRAFAD